MPKKKIEKRIDWETLSNMEIECLDCEDRPLCESTRCKTWQGLEDAGDTPLNKIADPAEVTTPFTSDGNPAPADKPHEVGMERIEKRHTCDRDGSSEDCLACKEDAELWAMKQEIEQEIEQETQTPDPDGGEEEK